ncbi:SdrD B-like domain-containing protein, partial [Ideonella livida]
MSTINLSTEIHVPEDQAVVFSVDAILANAGYTAVGAVLVSEIWYIDPITGEFSNAGLIYSAATGELTVDPAVIANWNGAFPSFNFLFDAGDGSDIELEMNVVVDPVNDAPDGTDSLTYLDVGQSYVFVPDDFGFFDEHSYQDADGNPVVNEADQPVSLILNSLPTNGTLMLNGQPVAIGDEISYADIAAGLFSFVPAPGQKNQTVGFDFQVRDDGGTALGGVDTDPVPNHYDIIISGNGGPSGDSEIFVGDKVWLDANGNGLQDSGEAGQGGVTVNLLDAAGTVVASTTTASDGSYVFANIAAGTYSVQFVAPAGYAFTAQGAGASAVDSDASTLGQTGSFTVVDGQVRTDLDAGLIQTATLGDTVFVDADADGVQDAGEAGLGGVTVTLRDAAGAVVATTTTDANGQYRFEVLPGTYSVGVSAPAGYSISPADQGGNDAADSDIDAAGNTAAITLGQGDHVTTVDAGLFQKASLGDTVFLDADADGVQDAGEAGKSGVTVNLKDAAGTVVATTTTDANGQYSFADLTPGTYSVEFVAPSGYVFSTAATGPVTLVSGESNTSLDAGLIQTATLGDTVFVDADADGVQDAGEAGLGGVTVTLRDA